MTIDPRFTPDVEIRLLRVEEALTEVWRLLQTVINKEQFNRLNVIRQKEMVNLETRLDQAEADVINLQEKYNTLL